MIQQLRLFAAIKVHPDEAFFGLFQDLQKNLIHDRINWVDPANIHITVKFFGEIPETMISGISSALSNASEIMSHFPMSFKDIGVFGSSYDPRVIWLGIVHNENLIKLFRSVTDLLRPLGYEPDRQNFVPHITLGRIKNLKDQKHFQSVMESYRNGVSWTETAEELILFESILKKEGPLYKVVKRFHFQHPSKGPGKKSQC